MDNRPIERIRDAAAAIAARVLEEADLSIIWRSADPLSAVKIEAEIRRWALHLRNASASPDLVDRDMPDLLRGFNVLTKE